ncbi:adenosylcobalamin-dependent ribonucleoside-diphosphate reductase [Desulfoplanes formicivorans]|uniref:Vitamin B12-dependent ribonucleotide reductase n=1 Tax=Desulfoplanes formicivorans TaxID=1592317 RepID=A0A194ADU2_9BACT|nr:adenosylcobalamin-dependent ribonucleoside-diphosphate reductase [Desulfoplanes formicivorans]GAU08247.1 ribonucleoside-diphosphate reductase [Desulfoplanes formicivorans]
MTDHPSHKTSKPQQPLITRESAKMALEEHIRFQESVSSKKYQIRDRKGRLQEHSFTDVRNRLCREFLKYSRFDKEKNQQVCEMIQAGRFIPAGSILSGLGNEHSKCSLSNCYLAKIESDSLEGIFEAQKKLARTYSYRGGSGIDITILRPAGDPVNNAAVSSSGAVSFMPLFSELTNTIGQNGRRGALMISLDIRHPDTRRFIWSKSKPEEIFGVDSLTGKTQDVFGANISLKVTDAFMHAVEEDLDWTFVFPERTRISATVVDASTLQLHPEVFAALDPQVDDRIEAEIVYKVTAVQARNHTLSVQPDLPSGEDLAALPQGQLIFSVSRRRKKSSEIFDPVRSVYNTLWDGDYSRWQDLGLPLKPYSTIKARELLEEISASAWQSGDPGILYLDTTQRMTPGTYIDPQRLKPMSTNPCGEQSLGYWNNCLLGAMVLHQYVNNPFTKEARFDTERFKNDIALTVAFMDTMSDLNQDKHPLEEHREADRYGKRIGIEFTGLGDMLAMLNMRYGSKESISFIEDILRLKAISEIEVSADIAQQLGCVPALKDKAARKRFLECPYITNLQLPPQLQKRILAHGLRHTAFNTVGPSGSISIMSDNCTSGIEPVFLFSYTRETRLEAGKVFEFTHMPPLKWMVETNQEELFGRYTAQELKEKLNYVQADELDYMDRIRMQAAIQKFTDSSISSTINLPEETPKEVIFQIYLQAWKHGLKGVTIFRNGCKKGVLGKKEDKKDAEPTMLGQNPTLVERELKDIEMAERHRVMWKGSKMYIIVSLDESGKPIEIFVKLPKEAGDINGIYNEQVFQEKYSLWETITRLASLLLRVGMPINRIITQLDRSSYNIIDAAAIIARILRHYVSLDMDDQTIVSKGLGDPCPECGKNAYVPEGGCKICKACGYTTCG